MNTDLIHSLSSMLKNYKRTLQIVSAAILALFVISLFFYLSAIDNTQVNLIWSFIWSFSLLAVGVAGLLLYKTTNATHLKGLLAALFYLLVFSTFRFLTYFLFLWYYYSFLSGYRLYYSLRMIYYAFCVFVAFIGVMAAKEPFRSVALSEPDLIQNTQNRSDSMGFPLFSISSVYEQIGQPLINPQNSYRAPNNSQAVPESMNQRTNI